MGKRLCIGMICYILLILAMLFVALNCLGLTAEVTWDIGDEPDLYGYTFLYNVDGGPWMPHRGGVVIPLEQMTQFEGRTGRWFTAPDNGKVYRVQPLAVDESGNQSICGRVVVIDTFRRMVWTEPCNNSSSIER